MDKVKYWYDKSYSDKGIEAQRRYPNEELLRFFGREYFSKIPVSKRKDIKVLELGCGACANLWMVSKEGFDAYGIDLSPKAINLGLKVLNFWEVAAELKTGSIIQLPYNDGEFDVIFDVISACYLTDHKFQTALNEIVRCLKKNGKFFSYTHSVNSDAFKNFSPAKKLDEWTLNGIYRKTSPYYGNYYPIHFISPEQYRKLLVDRGMDVIYLEKVSRTYSKFSEYHEFVVIVGQKQ